MDSLLCYDITTQLLNSQLLNTISSFQIPLLLKNIRNLRLIGMIKING